MPFLKKTIPFADVTVYFWSIEEDLNNLRESCENLGYQITDILAMKNERNKKEKLVVSLLLSIHYGGHVTLCHKENGAPFIKEYDDNVSISHSNTIVMLAVSHKEEVGVDVEKAGTKVLRVREKFLSPKESMAINNDDIIENARAWTIKEALFKVIPENEIDFKEHLHLSFDSYNNIKGAYETRTGLNQEYEIESFQLDEYLVSIVKRK